MTWRERTYAAVVRREVDVDRLAVIDPASLDTADETGYLDGNAMFQNLSGVTWPQVDLAVALETELVARLQTADDIDAEAEAIDEERLEAFNDADALWHLDVGVAGAVVALSALGCTPAGSCNAGGFGGHHQAQHCYVAFYLPSPSAPAVLTLAEAANVGLIVDHAGLAQLYSERDLALLQFARLAVAHHANRDL